MGYARHIGRVGALAVTLGVGVAIASTPGIAYADTTDGSSTSSGDSSSTSSSSSTGANAAPADKPAGPTSPAPDGESGSADESTASAADTAEPADDDTADVEGDEQEGDADDPTQGAGDEDTPPADAAPVEDDDSAQDSAAGGSDHHQAASQLTHGKTFTLPDASSDADSTITAADDVQLQPQTFRSATVADSSARTSAVSTATLTSAVTAPAAPQQPKTLVGVVTDFVAAVLQPLLSPADGSPIQIPILTAMLSLLRNELERILVPRKANVASQQSVTLLVNPSIQPSLLVDPTTQHVLVIGVDGTNLSRILADDYNQNFFDLMDTSTTAAPSIVGHTTVSNPSWSAILTGVWSERTGVINNVFTPWTYDKYPTVFNQLETLDPAIDTMAIGNWNVINAIAGAGSVPVDENVYVAQIEGDTNWLATDDEVADRTIDAIPLTGEAPNFLFSYFVGVDENGHLYGGASEEYKLAIQNMDDNLGDILDAVALRETAMGEDWTIIVVTDHGHQSQKGFGHGFQSPDKTATFVIVDGPDFKDGYVNQAYEIVDTTPTVVSLFGGIPLSGSDGVPLTSLGDGVDPVDLKQALEEAIAQNKSPDILTNVRLGLRTIFATIPYYIYDFGSGAGAGLPSFLVLPVKLVFDGLYVATNVPAQLVALLTGVSGASIFPLLPPPPPNFPPAEDAILLDSARLLCGGTPGSVAELRCGAASVV